MTTLDVNVTQSWVDIKTSLGLTAGTNYVIDNVLGETVYVREGATSPTKNVGHPIGANESRLVTVTSDSLWVRSNSESATIVLTPEV